MLMAMLGLCLGVAAVAGWLTVPALLWYASLAHPPFSPPNWLFGPVWTVMYTAMAVAAWLVWRDIDALPQQRAAGLTLWGVQLAVNASWTPLFFELHLPGAALCVLLALVGFVAATCVGFYRLNRKAGLLMAPYLVWVCFATYLNAGFWWLNR